MIRKYQSRSIWLQILLFYLFTITCFQVHANDISSIQIITSIEDIEALDTNTDLHAILLVSIEGERNEQAYTEQDEIITVAKSTYPAFTTIANEMSDYIKFSIVDVKKIPTVMAKWGVQTLPSMVFYMEKPKMNPYTRKLYRQVQIESINILERENGFRKYLKSKLPSGEIQSLETTLNIKKVLEERKSKVTIILASKYPTPSSRYKVLAAEYQDQGLEFINVPIVKDTNNKEEINAESKDILELLQMEKNQIPALVVMEGMQQKEILSITAKTSFEELKAFVKPFVSTKTKKKNTKNEANGWFTFLDPKAMEEQVMESKQPWMIIFTDEEMEKALKTDGDEFQKWKKQTSSIRKKAGILFIACVSCTTHSELCDKYRLPKQATSSTFIRLFPVKAERFSTGEPPEITRIESPLQSYPTLDKARHDAIELIPDIVDILHSASEVNLFLSTAMTHNTLPIVMFAQKKMETPAVLKSLALSFPESKLAFALVSDPVDEVKQQFNLDPSESVTILALVPPDEQPEPSSIEEMEKGSKFGVLSYSKAEMGPYTYPNIMRFIFYVLQEYPHPAISRDSEEEQAQTNQIDVDELARKLHEKTDGDIVPYLDEENRDKLCNEDSSGICVIGFFDESVDVQHDPTSRLNGTMQILTEVAVKMSVTKTPFRFMWTDGVCHSDFANAFGVGEFQMPTVVVYSPSKKRYAVKIGQFTEQEVSQFLAHVLSGAIPTVALPKSQSPPPALKLKYECPARTEVTIDASDDSIVAEDLDLLDEILAEEKEQKKTMDDNKKEKKKRKKKSKGKKKKNGRHDEL